MPALNGFIVRLALAVVLLTVFVAAPATQPRPTGPPPVEVGRWLDAVNRHQPGRFDEAAIEAGTWSHETMWEVVIPHLLRSSRATWDNRTLKLGAMLHTDIALLGLGTSDLRGIDTVSRNRDSLGLGLGRTNPHLDVARELLHGVQPKPDPDPDVAQWYHVVAAWFAEKSQLGDLTYHLERGRKILQLDAWFQFDDGCLQETMTSPRVEVLMGSYDRSRFLRSAERSLRRALELDPGIVEARVHLGRVLGLRGDDDRAAVELGLALEATGDPMLRYDSYLALGRVEERRRNVEAARQAYEAAARLYPRAQSPLVALSLLASGAGSREEGRRRAQVLVDLPADHRTGDDPWWTYDQCAGRHADRLLDELRSSVAGLAR